MPAAPRHRPPARGGKRVSFERRKSKLTLAGGGATVSPCFGATTGRRNDASDPRTPRGVGPLHGRAARAARRHRLDHGPGRARAGAVPRLPREPRAGAALPGDRGRARGRDRLHRPEDAGPLHDHGHRGDLGEGRLRPVSLRPGLLLGGRGQLRRDRAAHPLSLWRCSRAGARARRWPSRWPPIWPMSINAAQFLLKLRAARLEGERAESAAARGEVAA